MVIGIRLIFGADMVVKCLICNSYSVFHSWIGVKSRITKGCFCENQVWIDNKENIRAEDFDKIEIWFGVEQKFIPYQRYMSLCSTQQANHSNSTNHTQGACWFVTWILLILEFILVFLQFFFTELAALHLATSMQSHLYLKSKHVIYRWAKKWSLFVSKQLGQIRLLEWSKWLHITIKILE